MRRNSFARRMTALGLGLGLGLGAMLLGGGAALALGEPPVPSPSAPVPVPVPGPGKMTALPSGLRYEDVKVGDKAVAVKGKRVTVHYTGTLSNGKKFDSSRDRNEPFVFQLGLGQVIKGWDEGIEGMRVGGKRKLIIPPPLAYGDKGVGGVIPPNAELYFDIELLNVE